MSFTGPQLRARLVPPVAATPAQPRTLKLWKKKTQFDFWTRLKLVHSIGLTQTQKSRVMVKVEHCTLLSARTVQTIDYRFELSTVHVADNQLPVRIDAGKKD